jgi:hypothetical protein
LGGSFFLHYPLDTLFAFERNNSNNFFSHISLGKICPSGRVFLSVSM